MVPNQLGKFFPYYMKSKKPEIFSFLMRKQNADMATTIAIPIFGYTPEARNQKIEIEGEETTVKLALATTPRIIRIKATPSTWNLHKYLVIVKKSDKETTQKDIRKIFGKIKNPLENQPANFPVPRCGGRETEREEPSEPIKEPTMSAYMSGLETLALKENPQDAGPSAPPKRHRKFTISYASAAKTGILKQPQQISGNQNIETQTQATDTTQDSTSTSNKSQRQVSWDDSTNETNRSPGSSLSRSVTNSKLTNIKKEVATVRSSRKAHPRNTRCPTEECRRHGD
jgi:hypothetical protein